MEDGLFTLKTVSDLFRKLEYDFQRLKAHPASPYVAFDFFVTAEHMLDWQLPGYEKGKDRKAERDKCVLLAISSHIANGAKHFTVQDLHHTSVAKTSAFFGGFQSNAFQSNAFQTSGGLIIKLDGQAAEELGKSIGVIALAEKVMTLWEERLKTT